MTIIARLYVVWIETPEKIHPAIPTGIQDFADNSQSVTLGNRLHVARIVKQ